MKQSVSKLVAPLILLEAFLQICLKGSIEFSFPWRIALYTQIHVSINLLNSNTLFLRIGNKAEVQREIQRVRYILL